MITITKGCLIALMSSMIYGEEQQERAFLQGDLAEFTKQVSNNEEQQKKFIQFYNEVNKQLWGKGDEARKKGWQHFTTISLERLPLDHPEWYAEIKPFLSNPLAILDSQFNELRTSIRFFLTRYGAWCEFMKKQESGLESVMIQTQANNEQTVWDSLKSSMTYVANSVREGFNYVYEKIAV